MAIRIEPACGADLTEAGSATRVEKPWGYELLWTPPGAAYAGKLIHINAGARLSLQIHDKKSESWLLISGRAKVVWDTPHAELAETELLPGRGYSCPAGTRHRLAGITDCDIIEVSTPEIGTTYRVEDDFGREDETEEVRRSERGG
jgi:mannose-6-phosphate isomerase